MQSFDPVSVYLTEGVGTAPTKLNAFDDALIDAHISQFNLIETSSIIPPNATVESLNIDYIASGEGALLPTVYEDVYISAEEKSISAGVGVGIPNNKNKSGVIFTKAQEKPKSETKKKIREMIQYGMAKREITEYQIELEVVSSENGQGITCAIGAAILCDESLDEVINRKNKSTN